MVTFTGLPEPIRLATTSFIPAASNNIRTAPPAITPVPSGAGFIITREDPKAPSTTCGKVPFTILILSNSNLTLEFLCNQKKDWNWKSISGNKNLTLEQK